MVSCRKLSKELCALEADLYVYVMNESLLDVLKIFFFMAGNIKRHVV